MSSNITRPKWWQLYLTFPLLIALFIVDNRLKLSARGHQALQIGITLLLYGLIRLWLKANEAALSDYRQYREIVIVSKTHVYKLENTHNESRPVYQLQNPEINGVLSDTFEMDYIDAEFFSVDESSQESKKE